MASDGLRPPELREFAAAEYPEAARNARVEGSVVLRLEIDVEGRVTDAEVIEPTGQGLDEAARDAALRFRFSPARRGSVAVPARIRYRYDFRLPSPASVPNSEDPMEHTPPRPAAATLPQSRPEADDAPLEVTVRGQSETQRRRESAEAVTVVETARAQRESSDLGEVLARTRGVGVQRTGGLGSGTRFSLNGLTDDQVRFFLDGIPLELAGYPFGLANVPVALVERVELYSGVVPVRFAADALGGAVNLVTGLDGLGHRTALSYQLGSFDTHRLTFATRHHHPPTGLVVRASGFLDDARNDYAVDVETPDERGRLSPARVRRFHDAYRAAGGNVEVGVVGRRWARQLLLRAFLTDYDKEFQHNVVMTVPYGQVRYGESSSGASLRYEQPFGGGLTLGAVGGYAYTRGNFLDVATCVYDWYGRCVRERGTPGETDSRPHDQLFWDHSAFVRADLSWRLTPAHALRLSVAPTHLTRTGDERRQADPSARDPLTAERRLSTLVIGLEHALDVLADRLENIAFAKGYVQVLGSEEPRPGDIFRRRDRDTQHFGVGDGLRFRFTPWLYAKASYEWATRLPRPGEVFGDNAFVVANLELAPETSHNLNLGVTVDRRDTRAGAWRGTITAFARQASNLIVLLGNDRVQSYQNVFDARSVGVESAFGWSSRGEHLVLDGNATYVDLRNRSSVGTFADFAGDRIPNRPYLFANGSIRFQLRELFAPHDEFAVTWNTRYVHRYFRGWESVGLAEFKQVIPAQTIHGLALGYVARRDRSSLATTVEVQNLGDERVFDFFGVQRPGRAFYLKATAEF